jgi:outer membrane protein TolC
MELEFNIGQAELEVTQTNFLHRLIPQIHFSGSIGLKEILFIDPSSTLLSYLPKDAYRLGITLSINDIFDDSRHRIAELRLDRLRSELTRLYLQLQRDQSELHRELASLEFNEGIDSAELSMKEEVLRFEDLRFAHGKIEYDDLVRTRLEVLHAKKSLHQLKRLISAIRLKLRRQQ